MNARCSDPIRRLVWPGLVLSALAATSPALAAEPTSTESIEEIVVTAELRQSALGDTAASISVVNLNDLRAGAVNHLEEVLGWTPNVNYASGGARARFVQIRGIGERGQFAEPLNASVGLLLDGVDLTGVGVTATLFDIDQVEVLRGPQGTLYGANALAGLINLRSNDPTAGFETRLVLDAANYDARGVGGVVSGPLSDTLGFRLALRQYQDDGFMDNVYLDRENTNAHDELTLRGKLRWTPTETQTWTLSGGWVDAQNGYDAYSLENDRNTRSDEPGQDDQETAYASLRSQWSPNDAVTFVGVLGGSSSDSDYGYDEDWTYQGFHPDGYSSTDRYLRERDTVSLDLRLLSGPSGALFGGRTAWVFGLYALDQRADLTRRYTYFADDFESRFDTRRLAAYGEIEHSFTDHTRLIVGLRSERHRAEYDDSQGAAFDPEDNMYGGRVVLERDLADATLVYLSATRGYKVGGFNFEGTLEPADREYDPEVLWNYEGGVKGQWLDGRLHVQAALFRMQRDDVQVDQSFTIDHGGGSVEFIDFVDNAARGANTGFELEAEYAPIDPLSLFASAGLLHTEFDDFVNIDGDDLDGEPQAHAPEYQFYAGAEYRFGRGWYARVETEGKDDFYFSNSDRVGPAEEDIRSDAYVLYHASVGYETPHWSVKLWGRNLTDEEHATRGYYFGNDPRTGYQADGWVQLGEPRRYGVTVTVNN